MFYKFLLLVSLSVSLSFFCIFSSISAEETPADLLLNKVDHLGISHTYFLFQLLDPNFLTLSEVKVKALEKIAFFYRNSPMQMKQHNNKVLEILTNLAFNYIDNVTSPSRYYVRSEVCDTLISLEYLTNQPLKDRIFTLFDKLINDDPSHHVILSCIHALSFFNSNQDKQKKSIQILTKKLDKLINKVNLRKSDINIVGSIAVNLGALRSGSAYMSLLKILQSGYPRKVKEMANYSLKQLEF